MSPAQWVRIGDAASLRAGIPRRDERIVSLLDACRLVLGGVPAARLALVGQGMEAASPWASAFGLGIAPRVVLAAVPVFRGTSRDFFMGPYVERLERLHRWVLLGPGTR